MQNVIHGWKAYMFLFFDILFKMLKLTENNLWLFIWPVFLIDKNYIECTVEFKIKGDNFVNGTKIQ